MGDVLIKIRKELPADITVIRELNKRAFEQDQEANIVDALRSNGAAQLSLVATLNDRVVGHIMYSPLALGQLAGTGLGPMAVLPEYQRQGIGGELGGGGKRQTQGGGGPFTLRVGGA